MKKQTLNEQISRIKNMMGLNEGYEDWFDSGERIAKDSPSDWPNNERVGELDGLEDGMVDVSPETQGEIDKSHGSPYNRGRADSWYRRGKNPHKWSQGDSYVETIKLTDPAEIAAYLLGYDENESEGAHKDWGDDF